MADKVDANVIFFQRDESHDDAHELNRLISNAKPGVFSIGFRARWNECYQAYCSDRTTIEMADESNWA